MTDMSHVMRDYLIHEEQEELRKFRNLEKTITTANNSKESLSAFIYHQY